MIINLYGSEPYVCSVLWEKAVNADKQTGSYIIPAHRLLVGDIFVSMRGTLSFTRAFLYVAGMMYDY